MNYKQMLEKFEELDKRYEDQNIRLKLLEEAFWLRNPKPKFAPGTLPEVVWPDNFWITTKDST